MRQLIQEKETSDFKRVKLRLKIYHVSHPARAEWLVNICICRMPNNSWADVVRLLAERYDPKSNVKLDGF